MTWSCSAEVHHRSSGFGSVTPGVKRYHLVEPLIGRIVELIESGNQLVELR